MQRKESGHIGQKMLKMELTRESVWNTVKEDMKRVGITSEEERKGQSEMEADDSL